MKKWQVLVLFFGLIVWDVAFAKTGGARFDRRLTSTRLKQLTRANTWRLIKAQPLPFRTFHPQGLVRAGAFWFLSSVEVTRPPQRFSSPQNGFDRDPGIGRGHLFKIDAQGTLVADLIIGENAMYHPGGIDFDGHRLWISVAEYRPHSRSIIYRVDPATMKPQEVFRCPDHIGALIHDPEDHTLRGVSWGARSFYRWPLDAQLRVINAGLPLTKRQTANASFYLDYQDCKYLGGQEMLCTGVANYQAKKNERFGLGGVEIINLATIHPIYQLPIELWTEAGLPMTNNPSWFEPTPTGLRAYFVPEDDHSTLYVYETDATR